MSLDALPNEIIHRIIQYLNYDDLNDKEVLISLARSSRRLYDLTTPFIYKELKRVVMPCLLRSLLRNRALGKHTKQMYICMVHEEGIDVSALTADDWALAKGLIAELCNYDIWNVWPGGMLETHVNESGDEIPAAATDAKGFPEAYCGHWLTCALMGSYDALAALVLALLPVLSHLSVQAYSPWDYVEFGVFHEDRDYISRLMRGAANAQAKAIAMEAERRERDPYSDARQLAEVLPCLSSVHFECWDEDLALQIPHVLPCMRLPLMERFTASWLIGNGGWVGKPGLELGLRSLSILFSGLGGKDLGELVRCCPRLEKLVYEHGGEVAGYTPFEPADLMPGLRSAKGTLTELDIGDFGFEETSETKFGSLRDFTKLKHLSLGVNHLVGLEGLEGGHGPARLWEELPRSLQQLTIKGQEQEGLLNIIPDLQQLLLRKDEAVPALRRIFLANVKPATERNDKRITSLRKSCEAHGVHLFVQDMRDP